MWINTSKYSVPVYVVNNDIPKIPVRVSDPPRDKTRSHLTKRLAQGVRIPSGCKGAEGSDAHCFIWDKVDNVGYEFYKFRVENENYTCSWGAWIDDISHHDGRIAPVNRELLGARASGFSLVGGLMMYDDLLAGKIPYALSCGVPYADKKYVWPASRSDGDRDGVAYGLHVRFPKNIIINSKWAPWLVMMVEAVRDYGLWIVDQTHDRVAFEAEDRSRFSEGNNVYKQFYGKGIWEITKKFPFENLILA